MQVRFGHIQSYAGPYEDVGRFIDDLSEKDASALFARDPKNDHRVAVLDGKDTVEFLKEFTWRKKPKYLPKLLWEIYWLPFTLTNVPYPPELLGRSRSETMKISSASQGEYLDFFTYLEKVAKNPRFDDSLWSYALQKRPELQDPARDTIIFDT